MECKNCSFKLDDQQGFCGYCGAKVVRNRLTIRNLFDQFAEQFLSYDNQILKTFRDMFLRPEEVIHGYISGVRKRYVNVVSYLAIALSLTGFFFFFFADIYAETLVTLNQFQEQSEAQLQLSDKINKFTLEYQSAIFFLLIPFFALISRILFLKNKKYNYTEHVVINMYCQSHISIISILVYLATVWYPPVFKIALMVMLPFQTLFYGYTLKRLYKLSWLQIIGKVLLFFLIMIPVVFVGSILIAILLFATGAIDPQEFMEAERARRATSALYTVSSRWWV